MTVPISLGLWLLIHPLARVWRRIGYLASYAALMVPCAALGVWLWLSRHTLLGPDLGTHPSLALLGVAALASTFAVARMRRRQLTIRILTGLSELSREKGQLLTQGIYAKIRNPRYLELLLSVLGFTAIANYLGLWIFWVLCFPVVHIVVLLEEHELRDRFGAEYEAYCERVPLYLPRRS